MARVNIAVPDELLRRVKAAGVNVSRVSAGALSEELDRRAKTAALAAYLQKLESELGPVPADERREAAEWAGRALGTSATGPNSRTA